MFFVLLMCSSLGFSYESKSHDYRVSRESFFDAEPPSYLLEPVIVMPFDENEEVVTHISDTSEEFQKLRSFDDIEVKNSKPSSEITIRDAAKLIINYHPRIAIASSASEGEKEMVNVAKSAYYPQIKGGLGLRYDANGSNRYDKDYIQSIDLEVKQTIYDFGKTFNSVKSAEYSYLVAKAYEATTNEELIYTATSSAVAIVNSQRLLKLSEDQVNQVASISLLVEKRYEKGASNLSDLLQANSRLDAVKTEALMTASQYKTQLKTLGLLIGRPYLHMVSIDNMPQELSQVCSIPPDWEQIPELVITEFEAKKALSDLERASAEELPTISLQGSTSRPLNATSRYGSKFESSVSLNVSIPFYQGGGLSANKRASASRAQAASLRKEEVKLEISQRLSDTQVRLQYMLQRQNLLKQQVKNLRGTKELYKKQYLELGTRSLLDLLNSEQEFHQAQVEVENNKSEIIQAQLECAFYQGNLRQYFDISD